MLETIIRKIERKDIDQVAKIQRDLINYLHFLDSSYRRISNDKKIKSGIRKILKNKNFTIIVAEKNGKIIGSCIGDVRNGNYTIFKKIGFIQGMIIDENYRGKGIGEKVFKEMVAWFKRKKVERIEIEVDIVNKKSMKFWKKLGFLNYRTRAALNI